MNGDLPAPVDSERDHRACTAGTAGCVIVVPDGLRASPRRDKALPEPSFAFRAVLDRVVAAYRDRRILLAPGNTFGSPEFEQQVAERYLRERGVKECIAPTSPPDLYVDTRGNATVLREYLINLGEWPLNRATLVVAAPHAKRASCCFRRAGFDLSFIDSVRYAIPPDEPVVYRQWYYRYPVWHAVYEYIALMRDRVRN